MVTLIVIAAFIFMSALCGLMGLIMEYGWALFVIADILIAAKFLSWVFGNKKKTDQ